MRRKPPFLIGPAFALGLFANSQARADTYNYDWSTVTGDTVTLPSDNNQYLMTISNEILQGPLGAGTDTTASQLTIIPNPDVAQSTADTFDGAFDLNLVIFDSNGLDNHLSPLSFHITFTTSVDDGSTLTSFISLTPTSEPLTLGADTFTVGIPVTGEWFVAPPTIGSENTGAVGLSINFADGSGSQPPAVPEPSSLVLAGMGFAGLAAWRRKRRQD